MVRFSVDISVIHAYIVTKFEQHFVELWMYGEM